MTVKQYLRKCSVISGATGGQAIELSDLHVQFTIRRGDDQSPNSADVRVFNVSDTTAQKIASLEFNKLVVQAGYEGNFGMIFNGTVAQVRRGREDQLNTYIEITAVDADAAYNFATVTESLAAQSSNPAKVYDVLAAAMAKYAVTPDKSIQFTGNPPKRGRVMYGMVKDEMRQFALENNSAWSIQDGVLTVIPLTSYLPGDIPTISVATGLIGIPEQTQNGIEIRVLLNPALRIGRAIRLDNATVVNRLRLGIDQGSQVLNPYLVKSIKLNADGLYYVLKAEHTGDTRGQNWYTDLTCLAIDASIPLNPAITNQLVFTNPTPVKRYP